MRFDSRPAAFQSARRGRVSAASLGVLIVCIAAGVAVVASPRTIGIALGAIAFSTGAIALVRSASHAPQTVPALTEREAESPPKYFASRAVRCPLYLAAFLLSIDGTGYWSSSQRRYLVVILVLIPLLYLLPGQEIRRSRSWYLVSLGWIMGLSGSLIAFVRGDNNTWLQVFLPLTIVIIVGSLDLSTKPADFLRAGANTIAVSASIVSIVGALTWVIGLRSHSGLGFLRQEIAFVHISAIALSWVTGRRVLLLSNLASLTIAFVAYPAATYPIVVVTFALAMASMGHGQVGYGGG